ncbi:hypothetical protein RLIN73S_07149 [Rhodanobacter lindaniclasticus]
MCCTMARPSPLPGSALAPTRKKRSLNRGKLGGTPGPLAFLDHLAPPAACRHSLPRPA